MSLIDKLLDYLILIIITLCYLSGTILLIQTIIESLKGIDNYYRLYYTALVYVIAIGLSIYFVIIKGIGHKNDE